jgi:glucokinase
LADLLVGDIGGTKTLLALFDASGRDKRHERRFESRDFAALEDIVAVYLRDTGAEPESACFAVAGPVRGRRAKLTNLPWQLDADALGARCGIGFVSLVNDFAAIGHALPVLVPEDMRFIQSGMEDADAPRLVLGAGTGLGVCVALPGGAVLASEGGHIGFAPADAEQDALLIWMREQFAGRVSVERLLSGAGLAAMHRFTLERAGQTVPDDGDDLAARVTRLALEHGDAHALRAVDLFARIYGQVAGDLALALLARGGVYVAGGIAPRLGARIAAPFLEGFRAKGRYRDFMASLPVRLILDTQAGLRGAAVLAARHAGDGSSGAVNA